MVDARAYIHGQHQCENERVVEWWMSGLTFMVSINARMRGLCKGGCAGLHSWSASMRE